MWKMGGACGAVPGSWLALRSLHFQNQEPKTGNDYITTIFGRASSPNNPHSLCGGILGSIRMTWDDDPDGLLLASFPILHEEVSNMLCLARQ